MSAFVVYGRESELDALNALTDRLGKGGGGALFVRGEAGIGKSTLLARASSSAADRGMLVLTTTGAECEMHLPFAGLHQLLRPLLAHVDQLPGPQREALQAAFGMTDAAAPEFFLIALATLDLLADAAASSPLLAIVEDAQWLDRPSSDVLAFVARRVSLEPIVVLFAIREGAASAVEVVGLPELRLEPLDEVAAAELLDTHSPDLTSEVRERLLQAAAGEPARARRAAGCAPIGGRRQSARAQRAAPAHPPAGAGIRGSGVRAFRSHTYRAACCSRQRWQ